MIKSKTDLKEFIAADKAVMGFDKKSMIKEYLKGNILDVQLMKYIIALRYFEYCKNNYRKYGIFGLIWYMWNKHLHKRRSNRYNIYIDPNVFGKGLHIVHPGYIWIDSSSVVGNNCTVLPRVLFGKKKPGIKPPCIYIGDNCYVGTGTTILGPITIGNNVTIAANSIVIHDVPDNCIVGGNPARILKYKN